MTVKDAYTFVNQLMGRAYDWHINNRLLGMGIEEFENRCEGLLRLLNSQEPRVMTLEEVIERKDSDAVWVEHMDGDMIVQPAVLLPSFLDTDKDCIHFASSWRTGGSYSRRSYGTKWRCWTSRPTDEQREATQW